jgi:hypothetical protein
MIACFDRPETFFHFDSPYYGWDHDNPTKIRAQEPFLKELFSNFI